jgi:hypothetical protein
MKHLPLLVGALVAASALASCYTPEPFYNTSTSRLVPPPAYGSPEYVSSVHGYGRPYERSGFYPYSPTYAGGMGFYDRVQSPKGSYHYVYYDMEQPHPLATQLPLKKKTWRYTSRYPNSWGAPEWVTTFRPVLPAPPAYATTSTTTTTVAVTQTSR